MSIPNGCKENGTLRKCAFSMAALLLTGALSVSLGEEPDENRLRVGGYGELHLNSVLPDNGLRTPAKLDFHRFVLFFGYRFNDQWSFQSELELEHNFVEGTKKSGHLILEQAFLQWSSIPELALRAGVLLQPQGLVNETHEPTRFSTVERPEYHRIILPSTWFGAGIAVGGAFAQSGLQYDVMITEGLDDRKFGAKNEGIREGRQKGFNSKLDNLLGTIRLDYISIPGLRIGASSALNQMVSDRDTLPLTDASGNVTGVNPNRHQYERAVISEFHVSYTGNGFRSSAEFAHISYTALPNRGGTMKSTQGITAEVGYNVARTWNAEEMALYPFVRFSRLNTGGTLSEDGAYSRIDGGLAFHPIKQIAIKLDLGREMFKDPNANRTFVNAGIGYDF